MRGKPVTDIGKEERKTETSGATNQIDVPKPVDAAFSFVALPPFRNQAHLVSSTKTTTSKMMKIKSELFSLLYSFPEKALKWPELDATSEQLIQSAGETAANNVFIVLPHFDPSLPLTHCVGYLINSANHESCTRKRSNRRYCSNGREGFQEGQEETTKKISNRKLYESCSDCCYPKRAADTDFSFGKLYSEFVDICSKSTITPKQRGNIQ